MINLGKGVRRHVSLFFALTLAACGGGSAGSDASVGGSTPAGTPSATPTPTPTAIASPTPTPTPSATAVPTPGLAGLSPVASGVDVNQYLSAAWGTGAIPGPEEGGVEGAFRFNCTPSHNAYNDPVVFPGQTGRSHLHTFFGNTRTDANSTYESLRTTGSSTCNNIMNRSAYWVPAMMNGRGKVVMPNWISIYYKGMPRTDARCRTAGRACVALPNGLRYIFGYNMSDPSQSSPASTMWWNCDAANAGGHFANIAQAARGCPVGAHIGMVMTGPDCWNGTELDSPDHRSHLAYMQYDGTGTAKCPSTHPYILPHFTIGVWYQVDATLDRSGNESPDADTWYLSSDRMAGMARAVPGTTLHSDWFGAWEDSVMDMWMSNCIDKMLSCSGGDLGNGKQMTMAAENVIRTGTVLVDPPAS